MKHYTTILVHDKNVCGNSYVWLHYTLQECNKIKHSSYMWHNKQKMIKRIKTERLVAMCKKSKSNSENDN